MQLSAPTLPLDPSASFPPDGSGFPTSGGKGDSKPFGAADFGAMLSAESRNDSPKLPAGSSKAGRAGVSSEQSTGTLASDTSSESLLAAAGLVPPAPHEIPPVASLTIDIDLRLGAGARAEGESIAADTPSEAAIESSPLVPVMPGKPFSGEMLTGKTRAGMRAYGLNTDGPPAGQKAHPRDLSGIRGSSVATPSLLDNASATNGRRTIEGSPIAAVAAGLVVDPAAGYAVAGSAGQTLMSGEDAPAAEPEKGGAHRSATTFTQSCAPNSEITLAGGVLPGPAGTQLNKEPSGRAEASGVDGSPFASNPKTTGIQHPVAAGQEKVGGPSLSEATNLDGTEVNHVIGEKIAAEFARAADRIAPSKKEAQRLPLDADMEGVETSYGRVGINVAKPETHMPLTASNPTSTAVAMENVSFEAMPLSFDALVNERAEGSAAQMSHVARRAVESVLNASEQVVAGDQRSVRLQFTVGGEELAVRVEMRGDTVHTTFRTDSPELRSALAHEWQSVSAQSGGRTQRLADPVFASSSSGNGQGMSSDSGAAHQRESGTRNPQATADEYFASRHTSLNTSHVPSGAIVTPTVPVANVNTGRLHTFA